MHFRSSHSEVFCWEGVLKIYSKFIGEHPCRSAISIKLLWNFTEIAFRHRCSPVNLLHIFRTPLNGCFWHLLNQFLPEHFEHFRYWSLENYIVITQLLLGKKPQFHLISWYGNFAERHSFRIISDDSPETIRKLCLSAKFPHQEIRWDYGIFRR